MHNITIIIAQFVFVSPKSSIHLSQVNGGMHPWDRNDVYQTLALKDYADRC